MYLVTYTCFGDPDSSIFNELGEALVFIQKTINNENYGDFHLYEEILLKFSVEI